MRLVWAAYVGALGVLVAVAMGGAVVVIDATGPANPAEAAAERHGFNFVAWELRNFPEKWLYKIGGVFADNRKSGSDDSDVLERYFNLVEARHDLDPGTREYAAIEHERAWLEATAESIIEGRVTSVLEDQGLTMGLPPFTDLGLVFPPVDFEFDPPPRVLAVSPRDRLSLLDDWLLTPGLDRETAEAIEADAESGGDVSALVVQAGGVATYPSIITDNRQYDDLIDTVFHEWLHQYLVFYPLGSRYFQGSQLRTLNESVANLAGQGLAEVYFERYGRLGDDDEPEDPPAATPEPSAAPTPDATPGPEEEFGFTTEMRALRVQVEAMLAEGEIGEAEALMAAKRDDFEAEGVFIRKLNQAYFAFHGFYADSPGSIDPIGPKLETVFEGAGSPGEFVRVVRGITSVGDLDELVE